MSFHFDELESLISKSKNDFQIIGISETRLKESQETNIQLENFNIEHVPTESANGGVLLYIRKAINYKLRPDLMIYKKRELESVFIEIIQKDSKNMVVGCIYRHPCIQQWVQWQISKTSLGKINQWKQRSYITWWFQYWSSKKRLK